MREGRRGGGWPGLIGAGGSLRPRCRSAGGGTDLLSLSSPPPPAPGGGSAPRELPGEAGGGGGGGGPVPHTNTHFPPPPPRPASRRPGPSALCRREGTGRLGAAGPRLGPGCWRAAGPGRAAEAPGGGRHRGQLPAGRRGRGGSGVTGGARCRMAAADGGPARPGARRPRGVGGRGACRAFTGRRAEAGIEAGEESSASRRFFHSLGCREEERAAASPSSWQNSYLYPGGVPRRPSAAVASPKFKFYFDSERINCPRNSPRRCARALVVPVPQQAFKKMSFARQSENILQCAVQIVNRTSHG